MNNENQTTVLPVNLAIASHILYVVKILLNLKNDNNNKIAYL